MAPVGYMPDQDPSPEDAIVPYTANPLLLLWSDILLFFELSGYLPFIVVPIKATQKLDELYPSLSNIYDIVFHAFFVVVQLLFLLSIVLCLVFGLFVSFGWLVVYFVGFLVANHVAFLLFNGRRGSFESTVGVQPSGPDHSDERWIFLNGIADGHHWLKSNIDQLSMTFGRPILGVHNRTAGIVFDLIQCLIQRDFGYVTDDVREAYVQVKNALYNEQYKTVMFLMHSQGGIEGGLIIDWLLAEVPHDIMQKLEVYTFGNAANHFNNPLISAYTMRKTPQSPSAAIGSEANREGAKMAIRHIEHYANSADWVSRFGVLHFTQTESRTKGANRFMGKVFERTGSGHLFDQHYLDKMFTLGKDGHVLDHNAFMDSKVKLNVRGGRQGQIIRDGVRESTTSVSPRSFRDEEQVILHDIEGSVDKLSNEVMGRERVTSQTELRVRDLSRLWMYRNGMSPP